MEEKYITCRRGEIIFLEGEYEECMYDIFWGKVGIYANYDEPNQKLLTELHGEDFFGEMGLVDKAARSATAVALENGTQLRVITAENFREYFHERPEKILQILRHMSHRLRALTDDYVEACHTASDMLNAEASGQAESAEFARRKEKYARVYLQEHKNG